MLRTTSRRFSAVAVPLALALAGTTAVALASAGPGEPASTPRGPEVARTADVHGVRVTWRRAAGGFSAPTQVTSAPDGLQRLFVVQKGGTVRVFRQGRIQARPYIDLSRFVSTDSERGLLSIAFPPNFRSHPRVYVNYTRRDGDVVLARLRAASAGARHVSTSTRKTLLVVEHSTYGNHNGGQLAFGSDGMLYMGIGDGGGGGDPLASGQDRTSLKGKILRLDVSCGRTYCVPPGNPFAGSTPGRGEIWLLGLRNPWRMSFDSATGALWIGDVGQDGYEEVDRVPARPALRNLGWSCREGRVVYNPSRCSSGTRYVDPVTVVKHERGESVTGGYVYRGSRYRALMSGLYVFGDYVKRKVWVYAAGQGKVLQADRLGPRDYAGPTSFAEDDRGELWAVTYDGTLWRMHAQSR